MYVLFAIASARKMHPVPDNLPANDDPKTSKFGTKAAIEHPMKATLFRFAKRRTQSTARKEAKTKKASEFVDTSMLDDMD